MNTVQANQVIDPETLKALRGFGSCNISNAIERLDARLHNEGFTDGSIRCLFPQLAPMVGYAVTGRIRTSATPTAGHLYYERMDWWEHLLTVPAPRVIALQDIDHRPGFGALFGEIHAHIASRMECSGYVTNGTVRDLPGIERMGFHLFASGLSVSHAYAHIVDFGGRVDIGGLSVREGDLLHGDMHGVVSIPAEIAPQVPGVATGLLEQERGLIQFLESGDFSVEKLRGEIERIRDASR